MNATVAVKPVLVSLDELNQEHTLTNKQGQVFPPNYVEDVLYERILAGASHERVYIRNKGERVEWKFHSIENGIVYYTPHYAVTNNANKTTQPNKHSKGRKHMNKPQQTNKPNLTAGPLFDGTKATATLTTDPANKPETQSGVVQEIAAVGVSSAEDQVKSQEQLRQEAVKKAAADNLSDDGVNISDHTDTIERIQLDVPAGDPLDLSSPAAVADDEPMDVTYALAADGNNPINPNRVMPSEDEMVNHILSLPEEERQKLYANPPSDIAVVQVKTEETITVITTDDDEVITLPPVGSANDLIESINQHKQTSTDKETVNMNTTATATLTTAPGAAIQNQTIGKKEKKVKTENNIDNLLAQAQANPSTFIELAMANLTEQQKEMLSGLFSNTVKQLISVADDAGKAAAQIIAQPETINVPKADVKNITRRFEKASGNRKAVNKVIDDVKAGYGAAVQIKVSTDGFTTVLLGTHIVYCSSLKLDK